MNEISNNSKKKNLSTSLGLTARITGTIWILFFLFVIIFGYLESIQIKPGHVSQPNDILVIPIVACLLIALTGLIIAWWRPGIGGLISLFGFIIVEVLSIFSPKFTFPLPIVFISLLPSILYLLYWWKAKNHQPTILNRKE
jgi:hypothetical protein